MRRKEGKISITRSAAYSIGLHLALLFFTVISTFMPKKEPNLLVDIELAGEGEFREAMANAPSHVIPDPMVTPEHVDHVEPVDEEPKEIKEIEKIDRIVEEEPTERNIPEVPEGAIPEAEKDIPEEQIEEKVEERQEEPEPQKIEETKASEEAKINEEPVPKEEETKKKTPKEEKKETKLPKKKRKRNKKALMDVIKKAEKAKKRKDYRRKMQELASKEEKRKRDAAFDEMLTSNNEKLSVKGSGLGRKGNGAGAFGSGAGISEGDYEMVSSQIYPHWIVPSGVRDAENIIIEIHIELGDNGEVIPSSIKIVDEKRYATDHVFRAAADSARRAILQASPLSIPREKLDLFREITLRFNLKEALGE